MNGIWIKRSQDEWLIVIEIEGDAYAGEMLNNKLNNPFNYTNPGYTFIEIPHEVVAGLKGRYYTSDRVRSVIEEYGMEFFL